MVVIEDPHTEARIRTFAADLGVSQQEAVAEAFRRLLPEAEHPMSSEEAIAFLRKEVGPILDALPPEARRPLTKEEREAFYE